MTAIPDLIAAALDVRRRAYAPYSHYQVGAALLDASGTVHTGCNVENAAYPMCICAERAALVRAVSDGVQTFSMLVVATQDGGTPCGMCRQMLNEFAPQLRVIMVNAEGQITLDQPLSALLPHSFGPANLER